MQKLFTITTVLVTVLLLNSCRKEKAVFDGVNCANNCYILTGKLLDSASNTGINGGEIKFYFRDHTGTYSTKKVYLGKTNTDPNGNYTFRFDGSRFNRTLGYYYADAYKGNLFADPRNLNRVATFDLDTFNYNLPFIQNFSLFRPATIKVRVIASTVTNFRFLTVSYGYGKVNHGIVFNGGRTIDTVITWKTAGDLKTFIEGDAVGNGVNIHKRDTIVVPSNYTRQIEMRF